MKEKHKRAYMECAIAFSKCSNAKRLQVGAIAVRNGHIISEGYNGLPDGMSGSCEDENGNTRPEVVHAEDNMLRKLTRSAESSVGATVFITHACCLSCSIKLVDAKVAKVVYKEDYRNTDGLEWLIKNGVEVEKYDPETNPE